MNQLMLPAERVSTFLPYSRPSLSRNTAKPANSILKRITKPAPSTGPRQTVHTLAHCAKRKRQQRRTANQQPVRGGTVLFATAGGGRSALIMDSLGMDYRKRDLNRVWRFRRQTPACHAGRQWLPVLSPAAQRMCTKERVIVFASLGNPGSTTKLPGICRRDSSAANDCLVKQETHSSLRKCSRPPTPGRSWEQPALSSPGTF